MTARRPIRQTIEIPQGEHFDIARRLTHTNHDGDQILFDTSNYTANFAVRSPDWAGAVVAEAGETDYITLGYTPAPWLASTAYVVDQYAIPTALNGFIYQVTVAGTSAASEPSWPTTIGNTVVDGTVTWECISSDGWLVNFWLHLPSSYTAALVDFGAGVYTLEITDSFSNSQRLHEGAAYLTLDATY